ncbi:hypothetical protein T4B_2768 [Trichinella pseudospiralis]|uniref:Uncharacterized protein n=1 Tax=Trichinella pseudospiralis TaxID=6337 RepID=A0A0V1G8B4_TRIPS|nr:hypothetical protein T4B_2768 [Trichinella pseudospiralis]
MEKYSPGHSALMCPQIPSTKTLLFIMRVFFR